MVSKTCVAAAAAALPLASAFQAANLWRPHTMAPLAPVSGLHRPAILRARSARLAPTMVAVNPADVKEHDQWLINFNHDAFKTDVDELGKRLEKNQGEDDVKHLKKICFWSNTCAVLGLATMWLPVGSALNLFSILMLSLWTMSRWTTIAHHTGHGGYNRADETGFFNSRGFAQGTLFKRATQWFDWMLPEAWNIEHNNLHHYRLGEDADPDLVERNLEFVRDLKAPMLIKYGIVAFLACTWKWFYYSPNTYKELKIMERKKLGLPVTPEMGPNDAFTMKAFVDRYLPGMKVTMWYNLRDFVAKVAGPYLLIHFFLMPLPALLISTAAYWNCVATLALADVATNIHSFIIIATNHAGSDLYKFEQGCKPNSGTFYMRQVVSSANFRTGGDWNDFWHGWLNYQIEHHVWPSLSALSYQRGQAELQEICAKHGVPYVQESVWTRLQKTVDIMVGKADMRPFPAWAENQSDLKQWTAVDTSENSARLGQDVKVAPGTQTLKKAAVEVCDPEGCQVVP